MIKILICSGKGGVGKTTISVAISKALSETFRVGLVDADIDGPNVPEFMEVYQEVGVGEKIKPIVRNNLEMISMGFIIKELEFISWSSEKRGMAVQQLIENVDWSNNLDYMVLDTPPGTSDESEYITSYFKPEMIFVISTLHNASISDVERTISMLNNIKGNIKGVVINNIDSNIKCPKCGEIIHEKPVPSEINGIPIVAVIEYSPDNVDVSRIVEIIKEN